VNRLLEAQDKLKGEEESRVTAEKQVKELQARLEGLSVDKSNEASLSSTLFPVSQVLEPNSRQRLPLTGNICFPIGNMKLRPSFPRSLLSVELLCSPFAWPHHRFLLSLSNYVSMVIALYYINQFACLLAASQRKKSLPAA
jgi:hypothetical protein